jgi:hypothetical protein
VVDVVDDVHGKVSAARAAAAVRCATNGSGGTRYECHERAMQFAGISRLVVDAGLPAVIAEDGRSDLSARVAIDAGGVDEELAGDVFGEALVYLGHEC